MKLTVQHVDGMRFLATSDTHHVVIDAAPEDGGSGTALSAPQHCVAALGACILEFVLNSCRLNNVPVAHLSVDMSYEEMSRPRRIGSIEAKIRLSPKPSDELARKLVVVARRATLVTTFLRPPRFNIMIAGEGGENNANLRLSLS